MKVIYIAGFRQHAGKTMTSLGLLTLLKKYFPEDKLGYIKPVGQELFTLPNGEMIDKDGKIIEQFVLPHVDMKHISPVRLGSGVTKNYLRSNNRAAVTRDYIQCIDDSMESMADKEVIIAEGTGHPGVGAIVGLSNAFVSQHIDADILFLAGGGVGKTLDMLETDMNYLKMKGARVKGIVFNKLIEDKIPTMEELVNEDLINERFSSPGETLSILGYLPEVSGLNRPCMKLIQKKFTDSLVVGRMCEEWQKPIGNVRIISLSDEFFDPRQYVGSGDLVILTADSKRRLQRLLTYHDELGPDKGLSGIILTCMDDSDQLKENIKIINSYNIPAFYVREDTSTTDALLHQVIQNTKIQPWDSSKMDQIAELFEKHFDFEKFLKVFNIPLP